MDTPLLALTSRRAPSRTGEAADDGGIQGMRQLVQLRWIAVAGQLVTILSADLALGVTLPIPAMLSVVGLLALANIVWSIIPLRRHITNFEIMLALLLDVAALTVQLHLSGGATNPFVSFYLLQVVLAAILLEVWSTWVLVAITSLCFAGLTVDAAPLTVPTGILPAGTDPYTLGSWISFVLTGTLLGLFITRLIRNLRARDLYLADLRQQAVEEDGIVRMGLFASGAAHELGTPLASLSVILGDWRRLPRLVADAELAGELDEMQTEVDRCKAIVTGILHSAGEPRMEAMESSSACAFLDDAAAAWRPTHPAVPMDYGCDALEGKAIVASASLRQAIWNLLDNAAEVSPAGIALSVTSSGEEVVITVTDRGPGFPPDQLPLIGQPYRSSKGAGHGLGLFLAANVARRLGGRLEVVNRDGGGAAASLVLPLAPDRPRNRP